MEGKELVNQQEESVVDIPKEFENTSFGIRYRMDKDKGVFINTVTREEVPELHVRLCDVHLERVLMEEGEDGSPECICASDDSFFSRDGVKCATCPNINNAPFFFYGKREGKESLYKENYERDCKAAGIDNPQPWNPKSKCSLRLVVKWIEEFVKDDSGNLTLIENEEPCVLSCPKSSISNMLDGKGVGYLSRLESKGIPARDISRVVTSIKITSAENKKIKTSYSYEAFDLDGKYEDLRKKCANYEDIKEYAGAVTDRYISAILYRKQQAKLAQGKEAVANAAQKPQLKPKSSPEATDAEVVAETAPAAKKVAESQKSQPELTKTPAASAEPLLKKAAAAPAPAPASAPAPTSTPPADAA